MISTTLIEIVFVLLAIFMGSRLAGYIENNRWIEFFILVVLLAAGILFFRRKNKATDKKVFIMPAFIKGMFLNILSVQVTPCRYLNRGRSGVIQ